MNKPHQVMLIIFSDELRSTFNVEGEKGKFLAENREEKIAAMLRPSVEKKECNWVENKGFSRFGNIAIFHLRFIRKGISKN